MNIKTKEIICIIVMFSVLLTVFLYFQVLERNDNYFNIELKTTETTTTTRKPIREKDIIDEVSYEIVDYNYNDLYDSCYSHKEIDGYVYYTLSLGSRNTGGYSINIYDIQVDDDKNVSVFFNEITPDPSSMVIQVITYPSITIKFSNNVNSVKFYSNDIYEYQAC